MQTRVVLRDGRGAPQASCARRPTMPAKSAELHIDGGDAEIERNLLEGLVAPLEHLLRNAVSHGIESPERRHAAGKDATGAIRLGVAPRGRRDPAVGGRRRPASTTRGIRASAEKRGLLAANAQVSMRSSPTCCCCRASRPRRR